MLKTKLPEWDLKDFYPSHDSEMFKNELVNLKTLLIDFRRVTRVNYLDFLKKK